ncbi:MAG TPA: DUF975 family protein [Firmicutes bacterium]|nr:DUF975 family protein [Bacillota bacterium]
MEYQRALLKQSVRQAMGQTRPRPAWITLLYLVVLSAGTYLFQRLLAPLNWWGALMEYFLTLVWDYEMTTDEAMEHLGEWIVGNGPQIIVAIVLGSLVIFLVTYLWRSLMGVGYQGYCLAMVRGQNPGPGMIFCAFPQIGRVLLTRILAAIFVFLWNLLFIAGFAVVGLLAGLLIQWLGTVGEVLGLLLILAGLVGYLVGLVWASLRYALADYELLDQGVYGLTAIRRSKELMRGNVGQLFVLQLSFIGWYLLMIAAALVIALVAGWILVAQAAMLIQTGGNGVFTIAAMSMTILLSFGVILLVEGIISLWLLPYLTGSVAKFYDFWKGCSPDPQGDWSMGRGGGTAEVSGEDFPYAWLSGQQSGQPAPPAPPAPPEPPAPPTPPAPPEPAAPEQGPQGREKPPANRSGPSYPQY